VEVGNGVAGYHLRDLKAFEELGHDDVGDEFVIEYSSSRFYFEGFIYVEVYPPEESRKPLTEVAQPTKECDCGCCNGKPEPDEKSGTVGSQHQITPSVELEYNSVVGSDAVVHVPILISDSLPEVIGVELTFDGTPQAAVYYEKGLLENGQYADFGLLAMTAGMASGVYEWSARIFDPSNNGTLYTLEDVTPILNTTQAGLSSGWAVSGVDRLAVSTDNVLLVRPNGTWTRFKSDGGGGFTTPDGLGTLIEILGGYRWTDEDGTFAEFDEEGYLLSRVDLNGNTTTYTWDNDYLTEIEDAVGRVTTFTYTSDLLTSVTDPDGRVTTLAYDSITDELTSFTTPDPDDGGTLTAAVTSFAYSSGRLTTQTDAEGGVQGFTYDSTGRISTMTDAEGKTTSLVASDLYGTPGTGLGTEMDPATAVLLGDRQGSRTDAEGHVTEFTLDRFGQRTSETDELGRVTLYERDVAGHVITRTQVDQGPGGSDLVTTYEFDGDNQTRTVYADGHSEEWDYVSDTDRVSEYRLKDNENNVVARTLYEYDVAGNRTKETRVIGAVDDEVNNDFDPNNDECNDHIVEYQYLTATNGLPEGLIETITEWSESSGDDVVTTYTYYDNTATDTALIGLVQSVTRGTSALYSTTKYEYDEFGNLTRETQVVGDDDDITGNDDRITLYEYDLLDRVTKITRVAGEGIDELLNGDMNGTNDEYDDAVSLYQYDAAGRVVSETQLVGEADDPTGANDIDTDIVDDSLTLTEYDSAGRVVKTTQVVGHIDELVNADMDGGNDEDDDVVHSYVYDDGDLISETDALGRTTTYDYVDHQLVRRTDPDPDDVGALVEPVTEYRYDDVGRLTHVIQVLGELDDEINLETDDLVSEMIYDAAGRVDQRIDPLGRITTYTYDELDRAIEIAGPLSTITYVYDARGNVVDQFTTGDLSAPAHLHFEYDELGRRVASVQVRGELDADAIDPGSDPDDQVTTTEYDRLGRVSAQVDPLGRRTEYRYDGLGNASYIVTIVDSGETDFDAPVLNLVTRYEYNNAGDLVQITAPDPDGSGDPGLSPVTDLYYDRLGRQILSRQVVGSSADTLGSPTDDVENATAYDNLGRVVSTIDPRGGVAVYTYDALGRQTSVTLPDPDGVGSQASPVMETTYNKLGQVTAALDARGFVTTYEYDALNRLVKVSLPHDPMAMSFGYAIERTYDDLGRVAEELDALGRLTTYTYDAAGRLVEAVYDDTVDVSMTYAYDAGNRPEEIIDPIHGSMQRVYDDEARTVEDYVYFDSSWTLIRTTMYDDLGRVISVENAGSATTGASTKTYVYALDGQLLSETVVDDLEAVLRRTDYVYDEHTGWRTLVVQVKGDRDDEINLETDDLVTETVYDNLGRVISQIDPLEHATEYAYDRLGRVVLQTDAEAGETEFYYDQSSNRTDLVDPVGNNTHWIYDALNRVVEENQQDEYEGIDLNSRTFVYDAAGNLIRKIDRLDRYVDYVYDEQGNRTQEFWFEELDAPEDPVALGGSPEESIRYIYFQFDALSRLLGNGEVSGGVPGFFDPPYPPALIYQYDRFDRVVTTTQFTWSILWYDQFVVLNQTYDEQGNRNSLFAQFVSASTTDDFTTAYEYDAYGQLARLTQVQEAGVFGQNAVRAKWAEFTYNGLGQLATLSRGTSTDPVVVATYEYDAFARLQALTHRLGDGESSASAPDDIVAGYEYTYDAAGRISGFINTQHAAETADLDYDNTNQLTAVDRTVADEAYDYDSNGNRDSAGYVTDAHNRTVEDSTFLYEYDLEGNRIAKTRQSLDPADDYRVEYVWDYRNRLTSVVFFDDLLSETKRVEYEYDVFGHLIGKTVTEGMSVVEDRFVYDGDQVVLKSTDGLLTHRYVWGPQVDQLLAQENFDGGMNTVDDLYWQLTDHQNTVRDLLDAGGDSVAHFAYDSFGNLISAVDGSSTPITDVGAVTPFLYTARYFDFDSQLQNNWHRWFDAGLGKWISDDPIGFEAGDINLSRYVANTSWNAIDPTGLEETGLVKDFGSGWGIYPAKDVVIIKQWFASRIADGERQTAFDTGSAKLTVRFDPLKPSDPDRQNKYEWLADRIGSGLRFIGAIDAAEHWEHFRKGKGDDGAPKLPIDKIRAYSVYKDRLEIVRVIAGRGVMSGEMVFDMHTANDAGNRNIAILMGGFTINWNVKTNEDNSKCLVMTLDDDYEFVLPDTAEADFRYVGKALLPRFVEGKFVFKPIEVTGIVVIPDGTVRDLATTIGAKGFKRHATWNESL